MEAPDCKLFEIFKDSFSDFFDQAAKSQQDKKINLTEDKLAKMTGSAVAALSGTNENELRELKRQLEKRNIKIGRYINNGATAYVFELLDKHGKIIEPTVLRIEIGSASADIQSSVARWPIMKIDLKNGNPEHDNDICFRATIVPRAYHAKDEELEFENEDILRTFAMLNQEGNLEKATDINLSQIMRLKNPDGSYVHYKEFPDKAVGIIIDQNCLSGITQMGGVDSFCKDKEINYNEVKERKASQDEIDYVKGQLADIYRHAVEELLKRDVQLQDAPTLQQNANVEALTNPRDRFLIT
jgi:hypothetical protein